MLIRFPEIKENAVIKKDVTVLPVLRYHGNKTTVTKIKQSRGAWKTIVIIDLSRAKVADAACGNGEWPATQVRN